MTPRAFLVPAAAALAAALFGGAVALPGCQQAPPNVAVRTFERPERVDVVCMRVVATDPATGDSRPVSPEPLRPEACAPVPVGVDGSTLPNHLFAVVTQTTRGEVAVVDLTAGGVVDVDRASPGINFLPVGNMPTDVAAAPDGRMVFVASGEVNKAALYALPSPRLLGNAQGLDNRALSLAEWPACRLPEAPLRVAALERRLPDGARAGGFDVAVLLPGGRGIAPRLVVLEGEPFLRGAGLDASAGARVEPGSLGECPVRATLELGGEALVPATFAVGPSWPDGVPYRADAGASGALDDGCAAPRPSGTCGEAPRRERCCASPEAGAPAGAFDGGAPFDVRDAGLDLQDDCVDEPRVALQPGADGGGLAHDRSAFEPPMATAMAWAGTRLYVADGALPLVHVLDLADPSAPVEREPLLVTSLAEPSRLATLKDLATSPATRDYRSYLYGVDANDGSLVVYDVSDPVASPRVPLVRPHPELNPFQPPDRVAFASPVAAVSFARHDFALDRLGQAPLSAALSGLLCNPNPNVNRDPVSRAPTGPQGPFLDPGAYYRANLDALEVGPGPSRLRGVFAFATLVNGQVVALDVDDWDAPCRRPDPFAASEPPSDVSAPQASLGPDDLDPYRVPQAYAAAGDSPVTLEAFFPVSAPHRVRSSRLLARTASGAVQYPNLPGPPQLFRGSAVLATVGRGAEENPTLLPTATTLADPSTVRNGAEPDPARRERTVDPYGSTSSLPGAPPGVRLAWEDPTVHVDQDWKVVFEGALPGFDGQVGVLSSPDAYRTLELRDPSGFFCRRGVEDLSMGAEREALVRASLARRGLGEGQAVAGRTVDYVQITDAVLPADDAWWREEGLDCWDESTATPEARQRTCEATFGSPEDENLERDFPIVEAYDDHLVLGRFGYVAGERSASRRLAVSSDPSNAAFLKRMRCCFHNQVRFRVRAGGSWLATGSIVGYLHHVSALPGGRCGASCAERESLLNARSPALPRPPANVSVVPPGRNSPLAMRNPMFAFAIWNGVEPGPGGFVDVPPSRDLEWRFATRGQFVPLVVNLAASSAAVSPQSMRYVGPLGQLAVVDGISQGLVLIDLRTFQPARDPYF